ncbi:hypothetical protein Phum_PHUM125590 [Pediculus humanus corporis]|uniref:Uncharacterized protein n=1 Tax=Pediculus humanus subsp. corporis TaxID=121224 RepID=E0VDV2_PEDHC|nr:uncharacterized protein Phum_PHUM125590 [Pediculus humanus corporis]EEB11558.1 hypothetical protein Phum_PHUM125590 [Pediculus humanus corporis]
MEYIKDVENLESEIKLSTEYETKKKTDGIKRLEEQFIILKDKYDQQIEKLEIENSNLKKLLKNEKIYSSFQPLPSVDFEIFKNINVGQKTESEILFLNPSVKFDSEICKISQAGSPKYYNSVPKNSPVTVSPVPEEMVAVKEAFSQTEKDKIQHASVQCDETEEVKKRKRVNAKNDDDDDDGDGDGNDDEGGGVDEGGGGDGKNFTKNATTGNKENIAIVKKNKKITNKGKPFSDITSNGISVGKYKRSATSEHEMQLMTTLRGLQSDYLNRDRENRKLKIEIEMLKTQLKKIVRQQQQQQQQNKPEKITKRNNNVGTQTIDLGPINQRPYDPTLQSLHQVHEKEMAKLVSKLETQSDLTKHLHSLLVNR